MAVLMWQYSQAERLFLCHTMPLIHQVIPISGNADDLQLSLIVCLYFSFPLFPLLFHSIHPPPQKLPLSPSGAPSFHLPRCSYQLFVLQVCAQTVSSDGGLDPPGEFPRGSPGTLHFGRKDLAHHPLHLSYPGAGHGGRVLVGGRAERFPLWHPATRLHQCVLRQGLPHCTHPLLGAADCLCLYALPHLYGPRHAHSAQGGEAAKEGAGGERGERWRGRRPGGGEGVPPAEGERKGGGCWREWQSSPKRGAAADLRPEHFNPYNDGGDFHCGAVSYLWGVPRCVVPMQGIALSQSG